MQQFLPYFLLINIGILFSSVDKINSSNDAINDDDDEHLVHIGNIDKDSCTVDKEMEVNFAGVTILCGENYFLAGFDKEPKIVLSRANIVGCFDLVKLLKVFLFIWVRPYCIFFMGLLFQSWSGSKKLDFNNGKKTDEC